MWWVLHVTRMGAMAAQHRKTWRYYVTSVRTLDARSLGPDIIIIIIIIIIICFFNLVFFKTVTNIM
jgi:hypothetical protein